MPSSPGCAHGLPQVSTTCKGLSDGQLASPGSPGLVFHDLRCGASRRGPQAQVWLIEAHRVQVGQVVQVEVKETGNNSDEELPPAQ